VWDELDEPLGFASDAALALAAAPKRSIKATAIGAAVLAIVVGFLTLPQRNFPLDGEPFAVAKIEVLSASRKLDAPDETASVRQPAAPPPQVETTKDVKVTRGAPGASKALIIDVAQALGVKVAPAPDPRLVERSNYGPLPRIGADGSRPFEVYSRAVGSDAAIRASAARVALIIGGLGSDMDSGEGAIAKLPGAVTLGFAPTGSAVAQSAAEAREAGHETVLQARLADPSEETSESESRVQSMPASGLDSLHWQMGRFTGYVAVIDDFGGTSHSDPRTLSPILEEIARRGLGYVDAGASTRGMTNELVASASMPSAHADIVIDVNSTPDEVDAALKRLVEIARQRGSAIGLASATPSSVERLARWTNGLEAKGVSLVPLSALMSETLKPSAQLNRSDNL
jgi:uncharacterized protein